MKNSVTLQITAGLLILAGLSIATAYGIEPSTKTELLWPNGAREQKVMMQTISRQ